MLGHKRVGATRKILESHATHVLMIIDVKRRRNDNGGMRNTAMVISERRSASASMDVIGIGIETRTETGVEARDRRLHEFEIPLRARRLDNAYNAYGSYRP